MLSEKISDSIFYRSLSSFETGTSNASAIFTVLLHLERLLFQPKIMYCYLYAQITNALDHFYAGQVIQSIYTLEQAHIKTEEMAAEMDIMADKP